MMRVRLPKPLHGWRRFADEVGIIVLGVLIALVAGQVAQNLQERQTARDTRKAVRAEIAAGLASLALRQRVEPCIARRLGEIRQIVDRWGQSGSYETPSWIGAVPMFGVSLARYDAANAAGRLAPLSSDEQYGLGVLAFGLKTFADLQSKEAEQWARLRMLRSGAAALSETDRANIRVALQEAQLLDYRAKLSARQFIGLAARSGIKPDFSAFNQRMRLIWKSSAIRPSVCSSMTTPPDVANVNQIVPIPE
jgi:hypothetical protein